MSGFSRKSHWERENQTIGVFWGDEDEEEEEEEDDDDEDEEDENEDVALWE